MRQDSPEDGRKYPGVMGLHATVTTAPQVGQASSAVPGGPGWQWLHRAAQMAARADADAPARPGGDPPALAGTGLGWTCFPRIAMRTPGIAPDSVCAARRFTSLTMRRWGVENREADVAVVVSELLSNALRHGLPGLAASSLDRQIRLGLVHSGPSVLCAVADPSDQLPVPREPGWLEESGRGLHVIASLSDRWGSCTAPWRPGKVVWATFSTTL
jgi:anti-sigma regulatory factor (Ser/Thr protein kinase)